MAKNSEKTGSIEEKMPQLSALELLEMMQEIDRVISTDYDTEEEATKAAEQILAVEAMIQYYYPNVAVPRVILDVVSIAEPDRKKYEFNPSMLGAGAMMEEVMDFCAYSGTESWKSYISTARMILGYPALLQIFKEAMSELEKQKLGNMALEEKRRQTVTEIQEFMGTELWDAILKESNGDLSNGDLNAVLLAVRNAQKAVLKEALKMRKDEKPVFYTQNHYGDA